MRIKALLVAGVTLAAASANASTVSYTSNVVSDARTNYNTTLNLQQFDPSLGTLTGVTVTLYGDVTGNAEAESLDSKPSTVTLDLSASLTLTRPNNSTIVVTTPVVAKVVSLGAFDGVIDFGGTSGVSFLGVSASANNTASLSSSDYALFTGTGTVTGGLNAQGTSAASGAGNLITLFQTNAGGYATVTYTYRPNAVPEPAALALLGLGIGAAGIARRRKA